MLLLPAAVNAQFGSRVTAAVLSPEVTNQPVALILGKFTPAQYKMAALDLLIAEANDAAGGLHLKEELPITRDHIVRLFICTYEQSEMFAKQIGNITTSNYVYYASRDHKLCYIEKTDNERDCRQWQLLYKWPKQYIDTNNVIRLASSWLTDARMDIALLNSNCDVHVELDKNINTIPGGTWSFSAGEIVNLDGIVNRFSTHVDPVSTFVWSRFDQPARISVSNYVSGLCGSNQTELSLVRALNELVNQGPIFSGERFAGIALRPEVAALVKRSYHGVALAHLNRLLLEDAYPAELAKYRRDRKDTVVPIYYVYWRTKGLHKKTVALVRLFMPTEELLSLRVEDPKYILRKPLTFEGR